MTSGHLSLGPGAEFDHIRAIAARLGPQARSLGDDCAIVASPSSGFIALSTDLSIEGHHFEREWLTPEEIGWRAAAAALSDLAADGATPLGVLVSLGVPPDQAHASEAIMAGIGALAADVGAAVLGGDLSAAPVVLLDVAAIGRVERPVTRCGARPGDSLWVTGRLGGARAGLDAWRRGDQPGPGARARFARPVPRVGAGQWLAAEGAGAMIDVSDGFAGDAMHLAAASGVGLRIELDSLPVDPAAIETALAQDTAPQRYAALGGEDYELLAAMPPAFGAEDALRCQREAQTVLTRVGRVVRADGVRYTLAGVPQDLAGFDHFG